MSIASEFDSTIENIKSDYEGLENIGADLTNVNKNIQNIRTCLDNIYSNIPKTTGEGSNLSLSPTLKGKLNIKAYKGDTQQETYEGYNLLATSVNRATYGGITAIKNEDGSYKVTGTATTNAILYILNESDNITLPSGSYYLSGCPSGGTSETYRIVISVGGTLYGEYGSGRAITTTASGTLSAYIYVGSGTTVNLTYYPMLTSGNTQKPYQKYVGGTASPNPTYPQDIEVVTGQQEVLVSNKKVFDNYTIPETYQRVDYIQSSGTQYIDTGIAWNNASKIVATLGSQATNNLNVFISAPNNSQIWIGYSNSNTMSGSGFSSITITPQVSFSDFTDGTLREITFEVSTTKTANISFGYYDNASFQKINRIRNLKVYNSSNTLVRNMIACYRKSDNVIGMYDLVSNTFIVGGGTGNLTKGDDYQEQTKTLHLGDIELAKIGTYQDRIFETSGKNLLPNYRPSAQTTTGITLTNKGNGLMVLNGTASAYTQFVDSNSFELEAGTYTLWNISSFTAIAGLKGQLRSPDGLTTLVDTNTRTTFTLTETTQLRFREVITSGTALSDVLITPMILKGDQTSTIPNYEPYGSGKWYIEKNNKQITLGNVLEIATGTIFGVTCKYAVYREIADMKRINTQTYDFYCNRVSKSNGVATKYSGYTISQNIVVIVDDNETLESATSKLKGSIFYYPLATPTYEEITNTTLIEELNELEKIYSYSGQTNISVTGSLPMLLSVSALKGE